MKIIPVDELIEMCQSKRGGLVRRVKPGEEPDFVQKRYKHCTGMMGRLPSGETFSFDCDPPVLLIPGRGYKIETEAQA